MALKYKIGDRVRIKSVDWYNENKDKVGNILYKRDGSVYPVFFSKYMSNFCGEILTIKSVFKHSYHMNETSSCEFWTDEMIECKVEEETKPKFKVGDKVILDPYPCVVTDVTWRDSLHGFVYTVRGVDFGKMVGEEDLIFDTSEEETYDFLKTDKPNRPSLNDFMDMLDNKIKLPEGYVFKDENGNVINTNKIVLEKKKKECPKTYAECCRVLGVSEFEYNHTGTKVWYRHKLMATLDKLMLCRDAYWKLYGEEMGLGKPWEPNWNDEKQDKYGFHNEVKYTIINSATFVFPTAEMRDAFKENFKSEIEICKELL